MITKQDKKRWIAVCANRDLLQKFNDKLLMLHFKNGTPCLLDVQRAVEIALDLTIEEMKSLAALTRKEIT